MKADILTFQRISEDVILEKPDALVKAIANALWSIPDQKKLTRVADAVYVRVIVTSSVLPWNVPKVTGPLRKARSLVIAEAQAAA